MLRRLMLNCLEVSAVRRNPHPKNPPSFDGYKIPGHEMIVIVLAPFRARGRTRWAGMTPGGCNYVLVFLEAVARALSNMNLPVWA